MGKNFTAVGKISEKSYFTSCGRNVLFTDGALQQLVSKGKCLPWHFPALNCIFLGIFYLWFLTSSL